MRITLDLLEADCTRTCNSVRKYCEIVIHDLKPTDLETSMCTSRTDMSSNRQTGDGPSGIVLETLQSDPSRFTERLSYLTNTEMDRS